MKLRRMTPKDYTTEDFINDDTFVNWVLQPDHKSDTYWQTFLTQYPHKQRDVDQARNFVQLMKFRNATLDDISIVKLKSAIDLGILEDELPVSEKVSTNAPLPEAKV